MLNFPTRDFHVNKTSLQSFEKSVTGKSRVKIFCSKFQIDSVITMIFQQFSKVFNTVLEKVEAGRLCEVKTEVEENCN